MVVMAMTCFPRNIWKEEYLGAEGVGEISTLMHAFAVLEQPV